MWLKINLSFTVHVFRRWKNSASNIITLKKYLSACCGWVVRFLCNLENRTRMGSSGNNCQHTYELKPAFPSLSPRAIPAETDWPLYFMVEPHSGQTARLPGSLPTLGSVTLFQLQPELFCFPKCSSACGTIVKFYSFQWMKSTSTWYISWKDPVLLFLCFYTEQIVKASGWTKHKNKI